MSRDSDIVDYLLDELSASERRAIERRMREDADFAARSTACAHGRRPRGPARRGMGPRPGPAPP